MKAALEARPPPKRRDGSDGRRSGRFDPRPAPGRVRPLSDTEVTDDELTDAWEAGVVLHGGVGVGHLEHLRIAWVLHRRHGRDEARRRLLEGTRQACEVHGVPEKFDPALTERWASAIADASADDGLGASADAFIAAHPHLKRPDLFGRPRAGRRDAGAD